MTPTIFQILRTPLIFGATPVPASITGVLCEELFYIYGIGFNDVTVRAAGITMFPELRIKQQTPTEIQLWAPSPRQLQTMPSYQRNAIRLNIEITVANKKGIAEKSTVSTVPINIPAPYAGNIYKNGKVITIGSVVQGVNENNESEFLGGPAGPGADDNFGQARWYSIGVPEIPPFDLKNLAQTIPPVDLKTGLIAIPPLLQGNLATLRHAGQRLEVTDWHDDGITFNKPQGTGFVIIWRDDIPSLPVPFLDLSIDCSDVQAVTDWVNELWQCPLESPVPIPIGIGESIQLSLQRVEGTINNIIAKFLTGPNGKPIGGLSVQFAFVVDGVSHSDLFSSNPCIGTNPSYTNSIMPSVNRSIVAGTVIVRPPLTSSEAPGSGTPLTIQLMAKVSFPGCPSVFKIKIGPAIQFIQKPLPIPTMAIFFQHVNFEGVPLIMLPATTPFVSDTHWDARSQNGALDVAKQQVRDALHNLDRSIGIVQMFWNSPALDIISKTIGWLDNAAHCVIDATGIIYNLNDAVIETHWYGDDNFNDLISSVILIGPPHKYNGVTVNCFQHSHERGISFTLAMPDDTFVAAAPHFRHLTWTYALNGVELPLPYALGQPPVEDMNDALSCIKIG